MCDEKNENNVTNTEKIRIVKFDRAVPTIQLLILAAAIVLLAVSLAEHTICRTFLTLALFVLLVAIAWRVHRLYREGLTFEIQFLDEENSTRLALVAEEVPDDEEAAESSEDMQEDQAKTDTIEKHWTEQNYPDPDVELGLKPAVEETPEEENDSQ